MNKKLGRKIVLSITALLFSGVLGLTLSADTYADDNADMVWDRCGAVATDSVFYYDCAKTALGITGELSAGDLKTGSELYDKLGGETSRESFSFSDAESIIESSKSPAELDREATNCTKDASGWGWFACGLNKAAGWLTSIAYSKIQ